MTDRRDFIRNSTLLTAGLAFGTVSRPAEAQAADKTVVAVVGLGRGLDIATSLAGMKTADLRYLCDADDQRIARAQQKLGAKLPATTATAKDFRKVLDDPAVTAVVIATPNHWHTPMALLAMNAGKHVYVEKPCSQTPAEGEMLVEASRKHDKVVQHGTQRRSWPGIVEAVGKVHSGAVGNVRYARSWYTSQRGPIKLGKETAPPSSLDYSLWQGPAPERPYRENQLHYNWHWFWHYGGGECGNNGVHALDVARWGMNVDYPTRVTSNGGRYFFDDDQQTPDTHTVSLDFGDKLVTWEGLSCHPRGLEGSGFGVSFHGDAGTLVCDSTSYKIYDLKNKEVSAGKGGGGDVTHLQNFFDCIRTAGRPVADAETAHKSTLLCHLGNIAYRTGHTLDCDPKTGRIQNDKEAEALWTREYRKGWEPKV